MADVKDLLAAAGAASGNPAMAIGGAILGGLFGGQSSTQTQTANREPWGPAQDLLKSQIANTGQLQNYYQQNPFSPMQQAAYRNAFAQNDSMRAAPGVLQRLSSNQYFDRSQPLQRPQAFDFAPKANDSLGLNGSAQARSPLLESLFNNPYTSGAIKPLAPTVAAIGPNTVATDAGRGGDYASSSTPNWGAAALLGATLSNLGLTSAGEAVSQAARDGRTGQQSPATDVQDSSRDDTSGPMGNLGGLSPLGSGMMAGDKAGFAAASDAPAPSGEPGDPSDGFKAMGGPVTARDVKGPNPAGPDDGFTALQVGEYVIKKSAVNKYGQGLLDAINQGKLPAKALRGLL